MSTTRPGARTAARFHTSPRPGRAADGLSGRRVLIVGAGIAGLALARLLRRTGASVDVVERQASWSAAGAALYLPGNAGRALRALGLLESVAARAVEIERQRFCDQRGRLLCEIDVAALWADVGPCLSCPRIALHDVLRRAVDGLSIRMGTTVERLAQDGGVVSVQFSDGTGGEFDLVVGADGTGSIVRRLALDPTALPSAVGQLSWRFIAARPSEVTTWSVMVGRRSALLTLPISEGEVYCYVDVDSAAARDTDPSLTRLKQLLEGFGDPAARLARDLDSSTAVHVAPIQEVALEGWGRGHVVLIGDAAHATGPNMAQGAAMAIEDALVLAEELQATRAIPQAMAAFEARRRPRTDWVRSQTRRRDRIRGVAPAIRDRLVRRLGRRIFHANYRPLRAEP